MENPKIPRVWISIVADRYENKYQKSSHEVLNTPHKAKHWGEGTESGDLNVA